MASKWKGQRGKLPGVPIEQAVEAPYVERVNELIAVYSKQSDETLARSLADMKAKAEEMEKDIKELGCRREAINRVLVPRWEGKGQEQVKFTFGTFSIGDEPYPSVQDEGKLHTYLKQHKLGALIKPTVNWNTLKSAIKEMLENGKPVPEAESAGVSVFLKQIIRYTKST